MWTVIKFDKKRLGSLKSSLIEKFGNQCKIYCPKILIENFKNNKLVKKELNLLGDYIFCYHTDFSNNLIANKLKYLKGVKYLLDGFIKSQNELNDFITKCKKIENADGFITQGAFETKINRFYKFSSGPFTQKIFKIIDLQKNKIDILLGNIKTTIDKKEFSFTPL